jgi:polar amino acid transport system substrate-binding protein
MLCITLVMGLMAGCGQNANQGQKQPDASGQQGEEKEVWVVGTSPDYPPFEFVDDDGNFAGFDMDLIQEVGKRLGVEVKIEPLEFDSLIASLKQGKIDAIIACMSPDEERLKEADFTKAYYITKHGILVNPESDTKIVELSDVLKYEFGAQSGTTMAAWAQSQIDAGAIDESKVKLYTDANAGALDVKNGRLPAFIVDLPVAYEKAKELDLEVALETVLDKDEDPGIVLQKGSTEMIEKLNGIIDDMMEDGTIEKLEEKWFKQ